METTSPLTTDSRANCLNEDRESSKSSNDPAQQTSTDPHSTILILCLVLPTLFCDYILYGMYIPVMPIFLRRSHVYDLLIHNETSMRWAENVSSIFVIPQKNNVSLNLASSHSTLDRTMEEQYNGYLFAAKGFAQLLILPVVGILTDTCGYDRPLLLSLAVYIGCSCLFAVAQSWSLIFTARCMQGVASGLANAAGMALLTDTFRSLTARRRVMALALGFIVLGAAVGPSYGSILFEFCNSKAVPYAILSVVFSCLAVVAVINVCVAESRRKLAKNNAEFPEILEKQTLCVDEKTIGGEESTKSTPSTSTSNCTQLLHYCKLFTNVKVLCCVGAFIQADVSMSFLGSTLTIWLQDTIPNITEPQLGLVWLPSFVLYLSACYLDVRIMSHRQHWSWLWGALGLAIQATSCLLIPMSHNFWLITALVSCIEFGLAANLLSTNLLLAQIMDQYFDASYGSAFAIADMSVNLAYGFGPALAGFLVSRYGFTCMCVVVFVVNLLYLPCYLCFRDVIPKSGKSDKLAVVYEK